jgi:HD-GYP domain-containing protein (c-di-GMP phosphodiesterase class II)
MPKTHIETLKRVWENVPDYEQKHSLRTAKYALSLGAQFGLDQKQLSRLWRGGLLHDIGKGLVDRQILIKPGPLTPTELSHLRQHTTLGHALLATIPSFQESLDLPLYHHERWDGYGYPRGLKGEAIPLMARLLAVVDVWDALRAERPYSPSWPENQARDYILNCSGSQFDPTMVELFIYSPLPNRALSLPATRLFGNGHHSD